MPAEALKTERIEARVRPADKAFIEDAANHLLCVTHKLVGNSKNIKKILVGGYAIAGDEVAF